MAISALLNTAKESLLSHQLAIDVTGTNIANVNTPGYSRQKAVFSSTGGMGVKSGGLQIGVDIGSIERVYDNYLDSQIIQQNQLVGYHETKADILSNVETIFDESKGGGFADLLGRFWGNWQDLSGNPDGQVQRSALLSTADCLAGMFRDISAGLKNIKTSTEQEISSVVTEINSIVSAIGDLNERIVGAGSVQGGANLMQDKRTELLKSLGNLIDINTLEGLDGSVKIFLSNGELLVDGTMTRSLALEPRGTDSSVSDIVFADRPGEAVTGSIKQGKLGALIEARDEIIPQYVNRIDTLATGIADEVNAVHRAGFDRYRNTGIDFFDPVTRAEDMRVNPEISRDLNRIAASSTVAGDGDNALALGGLGQLRLLNDGLSTFSDYYTSIVGRIGQELANSNWSVEHQNNVMDRLSNLRESVSGVSVDEEMVKLIQYQLGYNAAGKLCSVVDEMLDTLMSIR